MNLKKMCFSVWGYMALVGGGFGGLIGWSVADCDRSNAMADNARLLASNCSISTSYQNIILLPRCEKFNESLVMACPDSALDITEAGDKQFAKSAPWKISTGIVGGLVAMSAIFCLTHRELLEDEIPAEDREKRISIMVEEPPRLAVPRSSSIERMYDYDEIKEPSYPSSSHEEPLGNSHSQPSDEGQPGNSSLKFF